MNVRPRRLYVLAIALVSMLALSATAAFAQYPPASALGVSCTDADAGETSFCTVVGAQPNEQLTATAEYNPVFYRETFNADANGEATFSFVIPEEAEGSTVTVRVVGLESGEVAADTIEVDDEDDAAGTPVTGAGTLPMTGGQVGVLLAIALTLLGGGLLALRRREDSKVTADA